MDAWERLISGLHVTVVRRLRGVAFFVSVYTGKTSEGLRLFRWRKVELWQAFVTFFCWCIRVPCDGDAALLVLDRFSRCA